MVAWLGARPPPPPPPFSRSLREPQPTERARTKNDGEKRVTLQELAADFTVDRDDLPGKKFCDEVLAVDSGVSGPDMDSSQHVGAHTPCLGLRNRRRPCAGAGVAGPGVRVRAWPVGGRVRQIVLDMQRTIAEAANGRTFVLKVTGDIDALEAAFRTSTIWMALARAHGCIRVKLWPKYPVRINERSRLYLTGTCSWLDEVGAGLGQGRASSQSLAAGRGSLRNAPPSPHPCHRTC